MELFNLEIHDETFRVAIAGDEVSRAQGLSGAPRLGRNKGMLFIWPQPVCPKMIMRDMNFALDFLFLDENGKVVHLGSLDNSDPTACIYPNQEVLYVLELKAGTIERCGLGVGSNVEFSPELKSEISHGVKRFKDGGVFEMVGDKIYRPKEVDLKVDPQRLQILDKDGIVVANIDSGSRIFSREHTKQLIEQYKKGNTIELARLMAGIIDTQNKQNPEYVKK